MKYIFLLIIFIILIALVITIISVSGVNASSKKKYKYSPTELIVPPENFLYCYEDTDCIKIKASACPPDKGGSEVCVKKDHFQQYLSMVEDSAGKEWEVTCPNINNVGNNICRCIGEKCNLVNL
jgi:CRISPR/Cas system CMR-associated protein Cmr1 (group 7 of RAMP superfamily)